MRVTDDGVPVQDLVAAIKEAIKTANVSSTDADRDLRVGSVRLVLHTIATRSSGGSISFTVPFIGTEFKLGGKVTRQDTHEVEINLVPPPGDQPSCATAASSGPGGSHRDDPRRSGERGGR